MTWAIEFGYWAKEMIEWTNEHRRKFAENNLYVQNSPINRDFNYSLKNSCIL